MSDPAGPGGKPPKPPKKNRPVLFWLGCVGCMFFILLAGVGGTMGYLLWREQAGKTREEPLPVAWRDSVRAHYRLPDAAVRLAAAPTDTGDALVLLTMGSRSDSVDRARTLALRNLDRGQALDAQDNAALAASLTDTTLERIAAAARRSRFEVRRAGEPPPGKWLLSPAGYWLLPAGPVVKRAALGLAARGNARLLRGDLEGGRRDLRAVTALGVLEYRNDVGESGPRIGRDIVALGASGLARLGRLVRDPALAADAEVIRAWHERQARWGWGFFFYSAPDSGLIIASDSSLPRGARTSAIESSVLAGCWSGWTRIVTGPPSGLLPGVRALEHDKDPVVAHVALLADSALTMFKGLGPIGRVRLASRGAGR